MSQLSDFATNEPYINFEPAAPKTTMRSSRSTNREDKPPVRLHSLQAFTCRRYIFCNVFCCISAEHQIIFIYFFSMFYFRGMMCEYTIPRETFIDSEDGDTNSLTLSVHPIVADNNWLTLDKRNKQVLHGISLTTGEFEFWLEARDSANQASSMFFILLYEE